MDPDPDELAGAVDLFGGLTREELRSAFADLAARAGESPPGEAFDSAIDRALAEYYLVAVEHGDDELLAAGPAALPRLPEGGEDLPHLLDVGERSLDREALAAAALDRLRADAARAVDDGDAERIALLLDVCYDLEAWADVDTTDVRERLDGAA